MKQTQAQKTYEVVFNKVANGMKLTCDDLQAFEEAILTLEEVSNQ